MISQISMERKINWRPEFISPISEACFLSFSSGTSTRWVQGRMVFNCQGEVEDEPYFIGIQRYYQNGKPLPWIRDIVSDIDRLLPPDYQILKCLDDVSANVSSLAAAYRIPQFAEPEDAAKCIIASRALLKVVDQLVLPLSFDETEAIEYLDYSSELSVIMGGDRAIISAMMLARDSRTFSHA